MTGRLAFVESPVQLLNVLEWAHASTLHPTPLPAVPRQPTRRGSGAPGPQGRPPGAAANADEPGRTGPAASAAAPGRRATSAGALGRAAPGTGPADAFGAAATVGGTADEPGRTGPAGSAAAFGRAAEAGSPEAGSPEAGSPESATGPGAQDPADGSTDRVTDGSAVPVPSLAHAGLTIVVLSPTDPMSRGQLRRMAQLARDEGVTVKWQEARQGKGALVSTLRELAGPLRAAERVIVGDPFSRYVQLLLTLYGPRRVTVVDDGTATMEFAAQLARGERLVRWHRRGSSRGPRELVLAPVTSLARRKLAPGPRRTVEIFTSLPVEPPEGTTVTVNDFSWTRSRFGPPRLTRGADLVGTSLVETGVVDPDEYLRAVTVLARTHGATRYFAHRRESAEKLHRIAVETGLEVVRPDLPLELIARRGPVGRTIVSFPSTVVHTLPLALAGTGVKVAVCEIAPEWLRENASPRAQGFLSGVAGTATGTERLEFG